jgi:phosphoribosylaminoimidazole carboxylase (NCAIR synthetase)
MLLWFEAGVTRRSLGKMQEASNAVAELGKRAVLRWSELGPDGRGHGEMYRNTTIS